MSFFKKVGDFFVKDVPKVVTQDIPKLVTKDIPKVLGLDRPNITDPEFYIRELEMVRSKNAKMKKAIPELREAYFTVRETFDRALAQYQHVTEDYESKLGKGQARLRFEKFEDKAWNDGSDDDFVDKSGKALRGLGDFVTLGLSEAFFAKEDGEKELAHLKRQNAQLHALGLRFQGETKKLKSAIAKMNAVVEELKSDLAAQGFTGQDAMYDARLGKGVDAAKEQIASDMLADGAPLNVIVAVTGVSEARLGELENTVTTKSFSSADPKAVAVELLAEGMTVEEVMDVTGLDLDIVTNLNQ